MFFLATRGLNFSIEFTGGTLIEVGYQQSADVDAIRTSLDAPATRPSAELRLLARRADPDALEKNQSSADLSPK